MYFNKYLILQSVIVKVYCEQFYYSKNICVFSPIPPQQACLLQLGSDQESLVRSIAENPKNFNGRDATRGVPNDFQESQLNSKRDLKKM